MHGSWGLLELPQFFQQIACVKKNIWKLYIFLPRTIIFIVTTVIEIGELLCTPEEACRGGWCPFEHSGKYPCSSKIGNTGSKGEAIPVPKRPRQDLGSFPCVLLTQLSHPHASLKHWRKRCSLHAVAAVCLSSPLTPLWYCLDHSTGNHMS